MSTVSGILSLTMATKAGGQAQDLNHYSQTLWQNFAREITDTIVCDAKLFAPR